MKTILIFSPTFHKGKPFWERQNSLIKTAETNRKEISKIVRGILLWKTPIKIPIKVIQLLRTPAAGIPVPRKNPFTPGYLLLKLPHSSWHLIFLWSTKINQEEMLITAINRKDKKEETLLVSKEKMEAMGVQGQGIIMGNQSKKKIETISRKIFLLIELETIRILRRN